MERRDWRRVKVRKRERLRKKIVRPMVWRPGIGLEGLEGLDWVRRVGLGLGGGRAWFTGEFVGCFCECDGEAARAHCAEEPGECEVFEALA